MRSEARLALNPSLFSPTGPEGPKEGHVASKDAGLALCRVPDSFGSRVPPHPSNRGPSPGEVSSKLQRLE